nr:dentin sialophosphoprotein [Ipomoea batatas]
MTLEDFFTLTEMNNGLATPVRVQELVAVMQKEKDANRSIADATRQWSAVASTIAATENKDCLELFIKLDGLGFIDSWLKNAQKLGNDSSDNFIEESITDLLRAVEKLHVGNEKSVSSGIRASVEKLLSHKSSKVQEMAKALFDRWDKGTDAAPVSLDVEKLPASVDGETGVSVNLKGENAQLESSCGDVCHSKGGCIEGCNEQEKDNLVPSLRSDAPHPEMVHDKTTEDEIMQDGPSPYAKSPSSTKHISDTSDEVETTRFHSEGTSLIETCSSTGPKHSTLQDQNESPDVVPGDGLNGVQKTRSSEKLDSVPSKPLDEMILSPSAETKDAVDSVTRPGLQGCADAKDNDCIQETSSFNEATAIVSDKKDVMDESGSENHCRDAMVLETNENTKGHGELLQVSSNKHNMECMNELGTSSLKVENIGVKEADEDLSDQSEDDSTTDLAFLYMGNKDANIGKKSDLDLDCGIFDPLEVARQVAIEVEREVEQSCSSVKKTVKVHEPNSQDSENAKQCETNDGSNKEVTMAAQDLEANSEKGLCEFDLNQDVYSEDTDQPSRAVVAPDMPITALQLEGSTGWKGSAVTSAFRPAACRIPESDKAVSNAESDGSSKQQAGFLGIDLNVTETGDERCTDLNIKDQITLSSALPSGESSVEASSKKLERVELDLDLNRVSDEGEAPSAWRMDRQLSSRQNGPLSQSPSSSSSSKQPSLRNIDLNDQPSFLNDSSNLPYFTKSPQNLTSVVSIMGMKVEVNQKELLPQSMPLTNGRISEAILDANRTALGMGSLFSYAHSAAYNYNNGITPGPAAPFSSTMYGGPGGPIPCMVNFRGVPVIPQIVGPPSSVPPPFTQQPFIISMTGPPPTNGVMASRSSFDLNSGLTSEAGNRDLRGWVTGYGILVVGWTKIQP